MQTVHFLPINSLFNFGLLLSFFNFHMPFLGELACVVHVFPYPSPLQLFSIFTFCMYVASVNGLN